MPSVVYNVFLTLMEAAPLETTAFTYYILTNYIEEGCTFPPKLWAAAPPESSLRTTNGAESFHSDYNRQFYSPHPHIHLVVAVLKEIQEETHLKTTSITKGKN